MNKLFGVSLVFVSCLNLVCADDSKSSEKSWSVQIVQNGDDPIRVESEQIERNEHGVELYKRRRGIIDKDGNFIEDKNYAPSELSRFHSLKEPESQDQRGSFQKRSGKHKKRYGWFTKPSEYREKFLEPGYNGHGGDRFVRQRKLMDERFRERADMRSRVHSIGDFLKRMFGESFDSTEDSQNNHRKRGRLGHHRKLCDVKRADPRCLRRSNEDLRDGFFGYDDFGFDPVIDRRFYREYERQLKKLLEHTQKIYSDLGYKIQVDDIEDGSYDDSGSASRLGNTGNQQNQNSVSDSKVECYTSNWRDVQDGTNRASVADDEVKPVTEKLKESEMFTSPDLSSGENFEDITQLGDETRQEYNENLNAGFPQQSLTSSKNSVQMGCADEVESLSPLSLAIKVYPKPSFGEVV